MRFRMGLSGINIIPEKRREVRRTMAEKKEAPANRDKAGRFVKGQSGNPKAEEAA